MTNAPSLDQRITVERMQTVGGVNTRVPLATVWAARSDVSDAEKFGLGVAWVLTSRFTIRDSGAAAQVRPTDFLKHDGRSWQVKGVKRAKLGRGRFLEVTATS